MFTLTIATLLAIAEAIVGMPPRSIWIALAAIVAGSIATAWRRTARVMREVEAHD